MSVSTITYAGIHAPPRGAVLRWAGGWLDPGGVRTSGLGAGEATQRLLTPRGTRAPVGKQQTVEVELEQAPVGLPQSPLGGRRVVHVLLRHEAELPAVVHHPIGAGERAVRGEVQGTFIGTDGIHLVDDGATGQFVTEVKCLDRPAPLQLIESVADAVNRAPEVLAQPPCLAVVVAVGEQHVLGLAVLLEPVQSLRWDHRIQQNPLGLKEVRADVHTDALVTSAPMPNPRRNLAGHGSSISAGARGRDGRRSGTPVRDGGRGALGLRAGDRGAGTLMRTVP